MTKAWFVLILIFLTGCAPVVHFVEQIQGDSSLPKQIEPFSEPEKIINKPHWKNLPITYYITNADKCGDYESRKIERAFNDIQNATNNTLTFKKINSDADINIRCSFIENCYETRTDIREDLGIVYRYETICNHALGIATIKSAEGYQITKAEIEFIGLAGFAETRGYGTSGFYVGNCGHNNVEIHEILHVLGYKHKNNPDSIMYYAEDGVGFTIQEEGACKGSKKEIDKDIVQDLIETYSQLP